MRKQPGSRTCFLCGRQNPVGLKMEWFNNEDRDRIEAEITIPGHFNGFPGIAHGGIVSAILDETAGRAVLLNGGDDNLMMTLKLEVRFRRPTPTGTPLRVIGWVIRETRKRASVAAELLNPEGEVLASCVAHIVKPPQDLEQLWGGEREFWRVYDE